MNNATNATAEILDPVLEEVTGNILTRTVQFAYWLITTAFTYFAGFVGLSVTMVYFK